MADEFDPQAMVERFRARAEAVRTRGLPPVEGPDRERFKKQAQADFMDFAMLGRRRGLPRGRRADPPDRPAPARTHRTELTADPAAGRTGGPPRPVIRRSSSGCPPCEHRVVRSADRPAVPDGLAGVDHLADDEHVAGQPAPVPAVPAVSSAPSRPARPRPRPARGRPPATSCTGSPCRATATPDGPSTSTRAPASRTAGPGRGRTGPAR